MPHFSIFSSASHPVTPRHTLFYGNFETLKQCVETAVCTGVDLSYADLRHTDLTGANLDDGRIDGADFTGSNLTGANLSESRLSYVRFDGAELYNTCFAYADLSHASLKNAYFGGTDITGTNLSHASFAGLSCFTLNFLLANTTSGCFFEFENGISIPLDPPPAVIMGISSLPLIMAGEQIFVGQFPFASHRVHALVNTATIN